MYMQITAAPDAPFVGIIAFPQEMPATRGRSPVRWVRANQDGTFAIRALPPGDYFVVAVDDLDMRQVFDTEILDRVRPRAEAVTLGHGDQRQVELIVTGVKR